MAKRILFMGPMPPPYMGQSIAFSSVVENIPGKHILINVSNKNNVFSGLYLCLKILFYLLFYKIDVIYFTCSRSFLGSIKDISLLLGARLRKIKVINHLHGADFKLFYDELPKLYRKIVYWCYSGVNTNIVLLEELKSEFSDFPSVGIEVIPNAYSKYLDDLPYEKTETNTDRLVLLYFSNIMKSKGIIYLLQAYEQILAKYEYVELHIAGIAMKDYIDSKKSISQEFSLLFEKIKNQYPGKIIYHGNYVGDKKRNLLWDSDVFILPTFYPSEAVPLSILEAMRAGNYIITTDHNYLSQIVSKENGCLIRLHSVNDIIQAIEKIIHDRNLLLETQNYNIKYAWKRYGEERYLHSLNKIIDA